MPPRPPDIAPSRRVEEYLAKLPAGVEAHPECVARAAMLRRCLAEKPLSRSHADDLPGPVRQLVICPPLDGEWVSDVHLVCVLFAIADAYALGDDAYLAWIRALNTRMFQTLFAGVLNTESPEAMLDKVPERWSIFHRGSTLAAEAVEPGRAVLRLSFPPNLFHGLALRQFAAVWEALLRLADPSGQVELSSSDPTAGTFLARWGPNVV